MQVNCGWTYNNNNNNDKKESSRLVYYNYLWPPNYMFETWTNKNAVQLFATTAIWTGENWNTLQKELRIES